MPQAELEIVDAPQIFEGLPLEMNQRTSTASAVTKLVLLVPALMLVMVPVASLVVFSAPSLPQIAEHPAEALLGGAGVVVFLALFGMPLWRAVRSLGLRRHVRLEAGHISVAEQNLFKAENWTVPLEDYQGLAHVVRTSLSGSRHELVLVHTERSRDVLLKAGERLTEADIAHAAALLRVPVIAAKELYGRRRRMDEVRAADAAAPAGPLAEAA